MLLSDSTHWLLGHWCVVTDLRMKRYLKEVTGLLSLHFQSQNPQMTFGQLPGYYRKGD